MKAPDRRQQALFDVGPGKERCRWTLYVKTKHRQVHMTTHFGLDELYGFYYCTYDEDNLIDAIIYGPGKKLYRTLIR